MKLLIRLIRPRTRDQKLLNKAVILFLLGMGILFYEPIGEFVVSLFDAVAPYLRI